MAGPLNRRGFVARKNFWVLVVVFLLYPVMAHAGGLGIAALVSGGGVLGFIGWPHARDVPKAVPVAIWLVMALLAWGMVSTLWSPYRSDDVLSNAQKMFLGLPLYLAFAATLVSQTKFSISRLQYVLIAVTFISSVVVLMDILSGYGVTMLVDPLAVGENMEAKRGDMIQNLGHAISVLTLLVVPVSVLLWVKGGPGKYTGKYAALALFALVLASAIFADMNSRLMALVLLGPWFALAIFWPVFAVRAAFFLAAASIFFAPVLGYVASKVTPELGARLPFSWEERVDNWAYMYEKILQKPWFGHGFDAVRTFNDTHTIRGFEGRALVSLHPHNAGLQIWGELGLVGAALACLALYFAQKKLTGPGVLSTAQLVALSGLTVSVTAIAGTTYGVWQDWWWATVIFSATLISFIRK